MDIYKLSDKIVDDKTSIDLEDSDYKITDLKSGVRNPERVNVYVNNKFAFSLDVSQVVDLKVKIGKIISFDEFEELRRASEFGKLYQRTLEWVLSRPHSERETRDYLRRKIFERKLDEKYVGIVIEKLRVKKYLDDCRFAEWYAENRFSKKGISMKRLKMELLKKGISKDIIEETLENTDRNDENEILKMIAKKRAKYQNDDKLIQYLCRQGFQYYLVRELVLRSCEMD